MADPQVRALAKRLQKLERARLDTKQPTLGYSSIDDGAITAVDQDSNLKMVIGKQFDGTQTSAVVSGPAPPTPTVPLAIGQSGSIRVYWDGTFVGGALAPMDFARVLVYAKPLASYTGPEPVNQTIIVGQFTSATGGEISAILNSSVEYAVYLVCWTEAGIYGPASLVDTATPISAPGTTDGAVPASSPNVSLEALGYSGVMIRWSPITNPDPVRYRIFFDTVNPPVQAFPDTSGTLLSTSVLPDGTPLTPGTTYYAQALALDDDGQAPSKGTVDSGGPIVVPATAVAEDVIVANALYSRAGYFGTVNADQIVTGELVAALAIVGGLSVGPGITITADNGIQITTAAGTSQIPTDGSAITLKAEVIAAALEVIGRLTIRGTDNEIAKNASITMATGVSDPKVGPQLSSTYYQKNCHEGFLSRGFVYHSTQSRWLMVESLFDAVITQLSRASADADYAHAFQSWSLKTDGGRSEVTSGMGGITLIGDTAYILCQTNEGWPGTFVGQWWIYKVSYNSAWTTNANRWQYVTRWRYLTEAQTTTLSSKSNNRPAIGNDGTDLWVVQAASNGDHYLTKYSTTGTLLASPAVLKQADTTTNFSTQRHCTGLLRGSFDIGTDGWIVMHESVTAVYWFNTSRNRVVANEFVTPTTPNGGILWDADRFRVRGDKFVWHLSKIKDSDLASNPINAEQSWRLADGTSPDFASAETKPSPRSQFTSLPKRAWLKITSPLPIPNDPSDANDPDALTFYLARGTGTPANSAYKRIVPPATGVIEQILDELPTTGDAPLTSSTFSATGSTPAEIKSYAADGGGAIIRLKGDGSGRVGPFAWDSSGVDTNDSGWTAPTLLNSWVNYGSSWEVAGYRKKNGRVQLRGLIKSGTVTVGTILFTLPTGFRPSSDKHCGAASAGGYAVLNVLANGDVKVNAGVSATNLSLADISFIAEA